MRTVQLALLSIFAAAALAESTHEVSVAIL
jgi:hypothetical protein